MISHPLDDQQAKDKEKQEKKDPKNMTLEEQVDYYKGQFQKIKKLYFHYEKENKNLEKRLTDLKTKLKEHEPESGETFKILFKFKHQDKSFYFFESSSNSYFLSDQHIEKDFREEINRNDSIPVYDYEKDLRNKDEEISLIISQYDERIQRLKLEIEAAERKIQKTKEIRASSVQELESTRRDFEQAIQETIRDSNDVYHLLNNTLEVDLNDIELQKEVFSKIKDMLGDIKTVKGDKNKWVVELKGFISKVLTGFYDLIHKQVQVQNEYSEEKHKWQSTLDQIIVSHQEEIHTSNLPNLENKMNENIKQNIAILNNKISNLEQDKYNIAKLKDQQIEILNKEYNKRVNVNLLKSVIIQILTTNDFSIQDTVLPVIYTALQFNDTEISKIKQFRSKNSSFFGFLSK